MPLLPTPTIFILDLLLSLPTGGFISCPIAASSQSFSNMLAPSTPLPLFSGCLVLETGFLFGMCTSVCCCCCRCKIREWAMGTAFKFRDPFDSVARSHSSSRSPLRNLCPPSIVPSIHSPYVEIFTATDHRHVYAYDCVYLLVSESVCV